MIGKIKSVKNIVKDMLIQYPETRDSDELLVLKIWALKTPALRNPDYPFLKWAEDFIAGRYANTESIRRSRQKFQELYPKLRGKEYNKRLYAETNMREQINRNLFDNDRETKDRTQTG